MELEFWKAQARVSTTTKNNSQGDHLFITNDFVKADFSWIYQTSRIRDTYCRCRGVLGKKYLNNPNSGWMKNKPRAERSTIKFTLLAMLKCWKNFMGKGKHPTDHKNKKVATHIEERR